MKTSIKLFGLIALVTVIVFAMAACDSGSGSSQNSSSGGSDTSKQEGYKTYSAYDEAGNAFILVVTENDTYVLSIQRETGATLGSSTGTVTSSNNTSYTLKHKGGSTFIVTINVNVIVSINIPIPLDIGGSKSPEGVLSPKKLGGTITKYTVTFDDNDATNGIAPNAQTVQAGSSITLPGGSGLSKTGFTFGGWNTNAYGTGINYNTGSSYTVNGNATLYAKWDAAVVINTDILGTWKTIELIKPPIYQYYKSTITYTLTLNADSSYIMEHLSRHYEADMALSYDANNIVFKMDNQETYTEEGTYTVSGSTLTLTRVHYNEFLGYDIYSTRTGFYDNRGKVSTILMDIGYFSRDGSVGNLGPGW